MIVKDHRVATPATRCILAVTLALTSFGVASAQEVPAPSPAIATDSGALSVTFVRNGAEAGIVTHAHTVGALLEEYGVRAAPGDYLSAAADETLIDGERISYREAVPVQIVVGKQVRHVRSSAATVDELLAEQKLTLGSRDDVVPARSSAIAPEEIVRIVHVDAWTARVAARVAPHVVERFDRTLARGKTLTLDAGAAGLRLVTMRVEKRGDATPVRTVLASRLLRAPRPRILVRGTGVGDALERVAAQGFASAVHFAGNALHMLATAYTAGCAGCSGITASGVRAGFGIIAVDPNVIPLGTRLFIPGYGRAVAGDTGGAINGRRIDLGFNSYVDAMRWGSRAVNVYVLR